MLRALCLLGGFSAIGCGDTAGPSNERELSETAVDPVAEGLMEREWLGDELGVARPAFSYRGAVSVDRDGRLPRIQVSDRPDEHPFEHVPETQLELFDLRRDRRYQVSLPADFDAVRLTRERQLERLARPEQLGSDITADPRRHQKNVIGADGRQRLAIQDGISANDWVAAIGVLEHAGCSGTLLSGTAYVTAAHCLFNVAGNVVKRDFFPRADATQSSGVIHLPWGAWEATQVYVPQAFTNNGCNINFTTSCMQYDVALVKVVPQPGFPVHPYTFQAVAETRPQLLTRALRNRGYPLCFTAGSPAGCTNSTTLYGNSANCAVGADMYPADPYSAVVDHSCDTNQGQSGSPIFYYVSSGRPKIVGVHSGNDAASPPAWNRFKRFSPNTLTWLNGLL